MGELRSGGGWPIMTTGVTGVWVKFSDVARCLCDDEACTTN